MHRWNVTGSGAILADVYFQLVGTGVEVSWDNRDVEENVTFQSLTDSAKIPKDFLYQTWIPS